MNIIARCHWNQINGAVPTCADDVDTYTWADERASDLGVSEKALGGIMSSLAKKGLICAYKDSENPDASSVCFTEAGFAAWDAHPDADKEK
jgi:hypothetical protein